jgi:prepilin-type N-terminal cleavage/methylation domain-containing protein
MSKTLLRRGLQPFLRLSKQNQSTGFTLIELLVALFIGSVITGALLFMVVKLLETNQREAARSDTQREVQMALDYISRDLREAVYVYDGRCLVNDSPALHPNPPVPSSPNCSGLLSYLPTPISGGATTLPVLAFWKVEDLPKNLKDNCSNNASAYSSTATYPPAITGVPCVSRRMYTLVVYTLDTDNSSGTWRGRARIKRYNLPQFTDSAGAGGTQPAVTPGWLYPVGDNTGFSYWPNDKDYQPITTGYTPPVSPATSANNQVLLDFVDTNDLASGTDASCPSNPTDPTIVDYVMTPDKSLFGAAAMRRGFYVCVKGASNNGNLNQEVVVRIQGNVAGRPGANSVNIPIPLETRVLTRGVLNKNV